MATSILVIPDPHDQPGTDQSRFEIAGQFALKRQPEYIVCLGDFAEVSSLSKYDVGRVTAEGKRYCDDIASAHKALARFNKPIDDYNKKHTQWKKKKYQPKMIMCLGNHENRIARAAQETPSMYGTLDVKDLKFEEYGWDVKKFLEPANIEGISFAHYFTSGVMGMPVGGVNHARSLLVKKFSSCVVGHSHLRGFAEEHTVDGRNIIGLVSGCYFDYDMDWTTENDRYWRGLVYLHDVQNGMAEPEFLNLKTYLKPKFG